MGAFEMKPDCTKRINLTSAEKRRAPNWATHFDYSNRLGKVVWLSHDKRMEDGGDIAFNRYGISSTLPKLTETSGEGIQVASNCVKHEVVYLSKLKQLPWGAIPMVAGAIIGYMVGINF